MFLEKRQIQQINKNEFNCESMFEKITENMKSAEKMSARCHNNSDKIS